MNNNNNKNNNNNNNNNNPHQNLENIFQLQVRNLATRLDSQIYILVTIVKLTVVQLTFALMKIVKTK